MSRGVTRLPQFSPEETAYKSFGTSCFAVADGLISHRLASPNDELFLNSSFKPDSRLTSDQPEFLGYLLLALWLAKYVLHQIPDYAKSIAVFMPNGYGLIFDGYELLSFHSSRRRCTH